MIVPPLGQYLWDWYFELSDQLERVRSGKAIPVPPSEFIAWRDATQNIVYPTEYAILCAIDRAYCAELNQELADFRAREAERAEIEAANKRRG